MPVGLAVAGTNTNDFKLLAETLQSIPVARPDVISEIICEWPKAICEWPGFSYDGNALSRLFGAKKSSWHPR